MTREDIIRMAQECYLIGMRQHLDGLYQESIERFAALVAAHERKECAKVCEEHWKHSGTAIECADAIRARGQE